MDVNVSVQTTPILVTSAVQNVIEVNSSILGTQGTPGVSGASGGAGDGSNISGYATSGNLQNTGIALQSQFNILSGNIINTGQTLYNYLTNLSGHILYDYPDILFIKRNGRYTGYYGTTDIERGHLLTGVISQSSSGDYIKLGPFNFDVGDLFNIPADDNFSIDIPVGVSIFGDGIDNTIITSNATGEHIFSCYGNNNINNLSILNTVDIGGGCILVQTAATGTINRFENLYLSGLLDCVGMAGYLTNTQIIINNLTAISSQDTYNGTASDVKIYNSRFKISNLGGGRCISFQLANPLNTGHLFAQNCVFESDSATAILYTGNHNSSLTLASCFIKDNSLGNGNFTYINNLGGNLYVDSNTIYDATKTSGVITRLPIFGLSGYSGRFITSTESGQFYPASNPNNFSSISNGITGSGISQYIPKFAPDGSGIIPGGIIDSGNAIGFKVPVSFDKITGHLLFGPDNLYDIGGTLTRPRNLSVGGTATIGGDTTITAGNLILPTSYAIRFLSSSRIYGSTDGNVILTNNADNNFNLLQLGGTTSSFPAIARSGNNIQIRAADSSSFASLSAKSGIFTNWVGVNLPLNTSPISALDVSGIINSSGITVVNNVASIGNLNLISNNTITGIILSGNNTKLFGNLNVTGQISGYNFVGNSLFSETNLILGTQSFTGSPVTGNFVTGITVSGTQNYLFNTTNMGVFSLNGNPGSVTFLDAPIFSGSGLSGQLNSYQFNIGGTNCASVSCENDGISGIRNESFNINAALTLYPSGLNAAAQTLGSRPFYINTNSAAQVNWLLPYINQTTGRMYYIKNRGSGVILSGQGSDYLFTTSPVINLTINSGEGYIIINDGNYWNTI